MSSGDTVAGGEDLREETERELRRVTDRLGSMPLQRLETTTEDVYACARALVAAGRSLGVPIPDDADLPDLGPQAYGDLIAVLGRDCLEAVSAEGMSAGDELESVLAALVTLRRALP